MSDDNLIDPIDINEPSRKKPSGIIKQRSINVSTPVKIENRKMKLADSEGSNIFTEKTSPILENGEIIGVLHRCSCGKETRIYFDYEEQSGGDDQQ